MATTSSSVSELYTATMARKGKTMAYGKPKPKPRPKPRPGKKKKY